MKKTATAPGMPSELIASRPRAFRRRYLVSVFFWLFLFAGMGFLVNTIYLVSQGVVLTAMISVTSSQIAHNYNVSEPEVRHLLLETVEPFRYKIVLYSLGLALSLLLNAVYCRKIFRRASYIRLLEAAATANVAPSPGDTNPPA